MQSYQGFKAKTLIPYCIQTNDITLSDQLILAQICKIVKALSNDLTCHEVCETIIKHDEVLAEKLIHVRGWFGAKGIEHSWLVRKDNPNTLIDCYPWCVASGPILLTLEGWMNPWRKIYITECKTMGPHCDKGRLVSQNEH